MRRPRNYSENYFFIFPEEEEQHVTVQEVMNPFDIVSYYTNWVKTSRTYIMTEYFVFPWYPLTQFFLESKLYKKLNILSLMGVWENFWSVTWGHDNFHRWTSWCCLPVWCSPCPGCTRQSRGRYPVREYAVIKNFVLLLGPKTRSTRS